MHAGRAAAMLTVTLNPSVDVSTGVAVVEPERKLHCGSMRREAGGGGVNVARVAHVLGADVTALVLVGGCVRSPAPGPPRRAGRGDGGHPDRRGHP